MFAELGLDPDAVSPNETLGSAVTHSAPPGSHIPIVVNLPLLSLAADSDVVIRQPLADGGMGRVSVGWQRALDREVAVKTLLPEMSISDEARAALLREAVTAGQLEHPNIVPIHLLGQDASGAPVLVMKRVSGVTWEELITRDDHPAWTSFEALSSDHLRCHLEILMQVATAVSFAHARGVLHRDIKPANVMIGEFGEVYLVDWGIAARFDPEPPEAGLMGTPHFVAPEMLDPALEQGPWTDVYLLGATLHFVLTGEPRHRGAGLRETLVAAWTSSPNDYRFGIPRELGDLANRATARSPEERPRTAAAFRRAVGEYLGHRASMAMSKRGHDRLAERPPGLDTPQLVDETFRIATECKFAFLTALREWPDNREAQVGMREALRTLARVEIARENPKGARALLPEINPPDPAIEQAIVELEARAVEREREASALRRLAHENDPTIDSSARFWLSVLVLAIGGTLFVFFLTQRVLWNGGALGAVGLVYIMVAILAVVCASVYFGRARLLSNAISRRVISAFLATMFGILLNRILALADGRTPELTLRDDMLMSSLALGILGLFASRMWLLGSGVLLAAALIATFVPGVSREVFGGGAVITFVSVAWGERIQSRRKRQQ